MPKMAHLGLVPQAIASIDPDVSAYAVSKAAQGDGRALELTRRARYLSGQGLRVLASDEAAEPALLTHVLREATQKMAVSGDSKNGHREAVGGAC